MQDDWRLNAGNAKLFRGAVFAEKRYVRWSPEWDHDHCAFCWEPFAQEGTDADRPDTHHEGFSTAGPPNDPKDDYYWVCRRCFADFRDHLGWTLRTTKGPVV